MHTVRILLLLLFTPGLLTGAATGETEPRPMTTLDFVELPSISSPALSPRGNQLLYIRRDIDWSLNERIGRYRLLNLETGLEQQLPLHVEEDESVDEAIWSHSGTGFATLAEGEEDDHEQVYFYTLGEDEFERLTDHGARIRDLFWAPDGSGFYFVADRQIDDQTRRLRENDFLIRSYDTPALREIWWYDLATGDTSPVVTGEFSIRGASISRDGKTLLYHAAPSQKPDASHDGELWTLNMSTRENYKWTDNGYRESSARLSPDGTTIAFIATVNEAGDPYYEDDLFLVSKEGQPKRALPDLPFEVVDFAWGKDGTEMFILGNTGLRTELYHYKLGDDALQRLTEGDHVLTDWAYDPTTGMHVSEIVSADSPGEIHVMRGGERNFAPVTTIHADLSERFELPRQDSVTWMGREGVTIEGLLVYPVDYDSAQAYPLVTITHGGPRSSSQFGSWNMSRFVPVLAGSGYAVLLPNHRGGTGYGDAFVRDMVGNYFNNAHHDVMDGVDAMIERGVADPDRLIKMGWSAGGHMTNKLITYTDRFKAASSGAGAADWVSMYGESDVRHNRTPWFGGTPWEEAAPWTAYRDQSPLKDAWKVETPTVFYVGESDVRVPPTQSILMHRAVEAAGAETRLYVAEDQPHGFSRPSFQLFKINTDLAWYAKHALGQDYGAVLPSEAFADPDEEEEDDEEGPEPEEVKELPTTDKCVVSRAGN